MATSNWLPLFLFMIATISTISAHFPHNETRRESCRLATFVSFPSNSPADPELLARHGFFYLGVADKVQCFSCGMSHYHWEVGDDVTSFRLHRSDCKMIKNEDCGNIPIRGSWLQNFDPNNASAVTGPSNNAANNTQQRYSGLSPADFLFQQRYGVKLPDVPNLKLKEKIFRDLNLHREADRLTTFSYWPSYDKTVSTSSLAERVFFYLGSTDRVQCIFCGEVFLQFHYGIDIDYEHCFRSPDCKFVKGVATDNVPLSNEQHRETVESHDPDNAERNEVRFPGQQPASSQVQFLVSLRLAFGALRSSISERRPVTPTSQPTNSCDTASNNDATKTSSSAEKRIKELEDEKRCKICLDKPANIVFIPCAHVCSCKDCAQSLKECPICRAKIDKAIRVYTS